MQNDTDKTIRNMDRVIDRYKEIVSWQQKIGKSNPRFREVWGDVITDRCQLAVITPPRRALLWRYLRQRDHGLLPRSGGTGE